MSLTENFVDGLPHPPVPPVLAGTEAMAMYAHRREQAEKWQNIDHPERYRAVEDQNRIAAESTQEGLDELGFNRDGKQWNDGMFPPVSEVSSVPFPYQQVVKSQSAFALRMRRERDKYRALMWVSILILFATLTLWGIDRGKLQSDIDFLNSQSRIIITDTNKVAPIPRIEQHKIEPPMPGQTTKGFSEATR
jgi:hypothetical protein